MTVVESELALLKKQLASRAVRSTIPWWERRFGAFEDDPAYEQAARLGTEYRASLRSAPDDDDVLA